MDLTTLQQILINYVPNITVLIGFLAACFGFLAKMKEAFKNSNIEEIKEEFKTEGSTINTKVNEVLDLAKKLMEENRTLKQQNNELLGELKRIANYEYKED